MIAAADQALSETQQLAAELITDRAEWLGSSVHSLVADDVLYRFSRPEAHLARQRDRLLDQLRALRLARLEGQNAHG